MYLTQKYVPRLAPLLLALRKNFENSKLMSESDNPKAWITKFEDIHYQMNEIRSTSCMTNEDFMLHVMGNLHKEHEAILTNHENRFITETGKKLTIRWCIKVDFSLQMMQEQARNWGRRKGDHVSISKDSWRKTKWVSPSSSKEPIEFVLIIAIKPCSLCIRRRMKNYLARSAISVESVFIWARMVKGSANVKLRNLMKKEWR